MQDNPNAKPRIFAHFDWSFAGTILFISLMGLLTLYSSTYRSQLDIFYKQLIFFAGGWTIALVLTLIDYRIWERFAYFFYGVVVALLIAVELVGKVALGAQRWLPLGPIHIQPSELAKLAIVFVLARFYSGEKVALVRGYGLKELFPIFLLMAVPGLLIFKQPDLGSTMMMVFVGGTVIFYCNLRMRTLIGILTLVAIAAPIAYEFVLHDFQRDRVKTFLDPTRDPLHKGYHALQSIITVGSGETFGKGFLEGTQSKLEFLPKHHTDFIFSSFAEEWGFVGSLFLLATFVVLLLLGIDICRKSRDKFGSVLGIGALSIIMWHVIVNMGMEIGLLPVVGVPLPFFSYGGSSLLTNMIAVGLLLSISVRRHIF